MLYSELLTFTVILYVHCMIYYAVWLTNILTVVKTTIILLLLLKASLIFSIGVYTRMVVIMDPLKFWSYLQSLNLKAYIYSGISEYSGTSEQRTLWGRYKINSAVLSFIERLSSPRRFSMYGSIGDGSFWDLGAVSFIERSNIQCPFPRVSFICRGQRIPLKVTKANFHPKNQSSQLLDL